MRMKTNLNGKPDEKIKNKTKETIIDKIIIRIS